MSHASPPLRSRPQGRRQTRASAPGSARRMRRRAPDRVSCQSWSSPYGCEVALQGCGFAVAREIAKDARHACVVAVEILVPFIARLDDGAVEGETAIGAGARRPHHDIAALAAGRTLRAGAERHHRDAGARADLELAAL